MRLGEPLTFRGPVPEYIVLTSTFPCAHSRFAPPIETTASLLVDSASLPLVKGSTIDYATELIGSAFRIRDNPQSKDAGCGCGVSESSRFAFWSRASGVGRDIASIRAYA